MQTVSRLVLRAFSTSISSATAAADATDEVPLLPSQPPPALRLAVRGVKTSAALRSVSGRLETVRCGFAKDMLAGPSTVRHQDGYGDDACFVAEHRSADVVGVADGVGGWREYGIDPSSFSQGLMKACKDLVGRGEFRPWEPSALLGDAYQSLRVASARLPPTAPRQPCGSSTACVVVLDRARSCLYTANLGDSGFLVLRGGRVVHRSQEQCHYFNTPYQLSIPPDNVRNCLKDSPDKAEQSSFQVETGDLVVVATDGLFDNLPVEAIEATLGKLPDLRPQSLQAAANSLALQARRLAFDPSYMSPFAVKAAEAGLAAQGGKPDDLTLILAVVRDEESQNA